MSRRPTRTLPFGALLLPLVLLLAAACDAGAPGAESGSEPASPFADCATLLQPPAAAATGGPPAAAVTGGPSAAPTAGPVGPVDPAGRSLPDVRLPCFTGGAEIALTALRGPAVINLWASSCAPCREELPAFQRLADRSAGLLHVVGVDVADRREAARSLAEDLGISLPNLYDIEQKLLTALAVGLFLPVTLFVDDQGRIRHIDRSGALDDASLSTLVHTHLGLAVPA